MDVTDDFDDKDLFKDKISHVQRAKPAIVIGSVLSAFLFLVVLGDHVPFNSKILWFSLQIIALFIRLTISMLLSGKLSGLSPVKQIFLFRVTVVIIALTWSSATFILYTDQVFIQTILIIILTGICSGASSSIAIDYKISITYITIILLPLSFRLIYANDSMPRLVGVFTLIFNAMLISIIKNNNRAIVESIISKSRYRKALQDLVTSENRFQSIFARIPEGVLYFDNNMIVQEHNPALSRTMKTSRGNLNNFDLNKINNAQIKKLYQDVINGEECSYEGEYTTYFSQLPLMINLTCSPIRDKDEKIIGGVGILKDITREKALENEIKYKAYHDTLTTLPNRTLLLDRLSQALNQAKRHNHQGALLFLDLDKFKPVNDEHGHHTGDLVLKEVGRRLLSVVRDEDTVSRIGGDEFVILLPELEIKNSSAENEVKFITRRIADVFEEDFRIEDLKLNISSSIGISIFPGSHKEVEDILKSADSAMYLNKIN